MDKKFRKNQTVSLLLMVVLWWGCSRTAVDHLQDPDRKTVGSAEKTTYDFPEDWLGYWQGDLDIIRLDGSTQTVPMTLDYRREKDSDRYHWAIIYGEDTVAGRRDYFLQAVDETKGHYQIDEQNSIQLDGYHFGNAFVSAFMVQGNYLTSVSRREGDELVFEIYMMKQEESRETGGEMIDSIAIPTVVSYPVAVRQVARLQQR